MDDRVSRVWPPQTHVAVECDNLPPFQILHSEHLSYSHYPQKLPWTTAPRPGYINTPRPILCTPISTLISTTMDFPLSNLSADAFESISRSSSYFNFYHPHIPVPPTQMEDHYVLNHECLMESAYQLSSVSRSRLGPDPFLGVPLRS